MTNRTNAVTRTKPRVVYYPDPAVRQEVVYYSPAQLAAKRREQHQQYLQWKTRQLALIEHDRKVRRFWLGFGAIVGTALVAAIAVLVWMVWTAVNSLTVDVFAIPLGLLALAALVLGGHRCITIVQHWH
jgi:hypothetical protein